MTKIVLLPFAGGGSLIYRNWHKYLDRDFDVWSMCIPGREERFDETLITDMTAMIRWLEIECHKINDYIIFGHSMGALIAFAFASERQKKQGNLPKALFLSGSAAPPYEEPKVPTHLLSEQKFRDLIKSYDPKNWHFDEYPELWSIYYKVLKADFELTYKYKSKTIFRKLNIPIITFSGLQDKLVSTESVSGWQNYTSKYYEGISIPGGHFFIRDHPKQITETIKRICCSII